MELSENRKDEPTIQVASGWLGKAAAAWALGASVVRASKAAHQWVENQRAYTVTVNANDEAWTDINLWLLQQIPPGDHKALHVSTEGKGPLETSYRGGKRQPIIIDGHRIRAEAGTEKGYKHGMPVELRHLHFTAQTRDGQEALLAELQQVAAAAAAGKPSMFRSTRWGDWRKLGDIPQRTPDTLVLDDGVWETITGSLEQWERNRAYYERLGIPWRHGIVLHGPPGTGKTSVCKAIAHHLGYPLYIANLTVLESDDSLASMFDELDPNIVLAIEDIDVLHASKNRDDDNKGITMSGLLNAIDGLASPEGIVTVMTTNRVDQLDEALIRPGRGDLNIKIGYLSTPQMERLVTHATGAPWAAGVDVESMRLTPAVVINALHPHIDSPVEAHAAADRLIKV